MIEKFGVPPESIPDYLGVVGDSADGFPGLSGWGAKSAAKILSKFGHIDRIPFDVAEWNVDVRGGAKLALTLSEYFEEALLFRRIATVDLDAPVSASVDELLWAGPGAGFDERCSAIGAERVAQRAHRLFADFGA